MDLETIKQWLHPVNTLLLLWVLTRGRHERRWRAWTYSSMNRVAKAINVRLRPPPPLDNGEITNPGFRL